MRFARGRGARKRGWGPLTLSLRTSRNHTQPGYRSIFNACNVMGSSKRSGSPGTSVTASHTAGSSEVFASGL